MCSFGNVYQKPFTESKWNKVLYSIKEKNYLNERYNANGEDSNNGSKTIAHNPPKDRGMCIVYTKAFSVYCIMYAIGILRLFAN